MANGFQAQRDFVRLASACTKLPTSAPEYQELIAPTQSALLAVIDVKEKNRASKENNQLTVVSEGIPALGWVTLVSPLSDEHGRQTDLTFSIARYRTVNRVLTSASSRMAACSG